MLNGPANKNVQTRTLELIAKFSLAYPGQVQFERLKGWLSSDITATVAGLKFNLTKLLAQADLNHVQLDAADSKAFMDEVVCLPFEGHTDKQHQSLSPAEKAAINDYTVTGYHLVNPLLYGNYDKITNVRDAFLKTMMLSSGLNKIMPDLKTTPLYRGEVFIPEAELAKRQQYSMTQAIQHVPAFKSASAAKSVAWEGDFGKGVKVLIENGAGKDITELAALTKEQERLLGPEMWQWLGLTDFNGETVYRAQIVRPLEEDKNIASEAQVDAYKQLKQLWTQRHKPEPKPILNYYQDKKAIDAVAFNQQAPSFSEVVFEFFEQLQPGFEEDEVINPNPKPTPIRVR